MSDSGDGSGDGSDSGGGQDLYDVVLELLVVSLNMTDSEDPAHVLCRDLGEVLFGITHTGELGGVVPRGVPCSRHMAWRMVELYSSGALRSALHVSRLVGQLRSATAAMVHTPALRAELEVASKRRYVRWLRRTALRDLPSDDVAAHVLSWLSPSRWVRRWLDH